MSLFILRTLIFATLVYSCYSSIECTINWRSDSAKCRSIGIVFNYLNQENFVGLSNRLIHLDMRDCKLATIEERSFHIFTELQSLDLSMNFLNSSVKKSVLGDLKNVRSLNLSNNMIESIEENAFENMEKLEILDLSRNLLDSMVISTVQKVGNRLIFLDLSHNLDLGAVTDIYERVNLKSLSLAKSYAAFPDQARFEESNRLVYLDISDNPDMFLSGDMRAIVESCQYLQNLNMASVGLKTMRLGGNAQLHTLNVSKNALENIDMDTLKSNIELVVLDMSSNSIENLPSGVFNMNTKILKLLLRGNKMSLLEPGLFSKLKNLEVLDLGSNRLTSLPRSIFENNYGMYSLDLSGNQFASLDYRFVGLKVLHLGDNRLNNVSEEIVGNRDLKILNLSCNELVSIPFTHLIHGRTIDIVLGGNPWNCGCLDEMIKNKPPTTHFPNELFSDGESISCVVEGGLNACSRKLSLENRKRWLEKHRTHLYVCDSKKL